MTSIYASSAPGVISNRPQATTSQPSFGGVLLETDKDHNPKKLSIHNPTLWESFSSVFTRNPLYRLGVFTVDTGERRYQLPEAKSQVELLELQIGQPERMNENLTVNPTIHANRFKADIISLLGKVKDRQRRILAHTPGLDAAMRTVNRLPIEKLLPNRQRTVVIDFKA